MSCFLLQSTVCSLFPPFHYGLVYTQTKKKWQKWKIVSFEGKNILEMGKFRRGKLKYTKAGGALPP